MNLLSEVRHELLFLLEVHGCLDQMPAAQLQVLEDELARILCTVRRAALTDAFKATRPVVHGERLVDGSEN